MRVIEPKNNKVNPKQVRKDRGVFTALLSLLILLLAFSFFNKNDTQEYNKSIDQTESFNTAIEKEQLIDESVNSSSLILGNELRLLYDNLIFENTKQINQPPVITGNDIADARIRQLAESRGYKLRPEADVVLSVIDGFLLQEVIREPWKSMKSAIRITGSEISITSGYRSIEDQKELFLGRLISEGVTTNEIVDGVADEIILTVLSRAALPGYSKHHSGYTIDINCNGEPIRTFKDSTCHEWLTANNYANSKAYGFIPSYPADASLQGPDPEAWEYVYVGKEVLNNN